MWQADESSAVSNVPASSPRPITTPLPPVRPVTAPEPATGPRCPGFCLLNIMAAFCERPSVLIPHTSNCKRGSVCCDNTRVSPTSARPPPPHYPRPPPQHAVTHATTTAAPETATDPRPECPGSCIVSYLSFTCFRKYTYFKLKLKFSLGILGI